jgi:hypothetical protein
MSRRTLALATTNISSSGRLTAEQVLTVEQLLNPGFNPNAESDADIDEGDEIGIPGYGAYLHHGFCHLLWIHPAVAHGFCSRYW